MNGEPFHVRLARLRVGSGLTQKELANTVGVSSQRVSGWMQGTRLPRIDMIAPLAEALGVSCDVLLTGRERKA